MPPGPLGPADTTESNAAAAKTRGALTAAAPHPSGLPRGGYFTVDPVFLGTASTQPYQRTSDDPVYRPLRIFALDPSASRLDGAIATINLAYETLRPGPRGAVLEVADWDETTGTEHPRLDLDDHKVLIRNGREPSITDLQFHQQMTYAVCSSTYNAFRSALGRDPSWGFPARPGETRPILRLRPHAFRGQNAFYQPQTGEIHFGYYDAATSVSGHNLPCGEIYTCLSHDIVVHEMAHALLDGQRRRLLLPTHRDVAAFHEGFADLVAILTRFSYRDVVRAAIERSNGDPLTDALLLSVASQFGQTTGQGASLRSGIERKGLASNGADDRPTSYEEAGTEPHRLGSVMVTAVFEAFGTLFRRRVAAYRRLARHAPAGSTDPELCDILGEEASRLAQQFLSICIRALDYCPPVDLRLGEYLRALVTADYDLVPDDPLAYREALIYAFARRGIYPPDVRSLSEDALLWQGPELKLEPIKDLHFGNLRFAGDPGRTADAGELRRQAEALGAYVMRPRIAREFGCALPGDPDLRGDRVEPAEICSIRSLRRIGPDKAVSFDLVGEIVQRRWLSRPGQTPVEALGGATVIIGADGRIRYVIRKSVTDARRMAAHRDQALARQDYDEDGSCCRLRQTSLRALHQNRTAVRPERP
ncbi:hypothetical protein ABZT49_28050 [Methylobacterium sp. EM32]|uniref:hypothetical protein n=1 Tax=Methylobacterium sp. EM32 TaxID=3163481 RepID=UPI0033B5F605